MSPHLKLKFGAATSAAIAVAGLLLAPPMWSGVLIAIFAGAAYGAIYARAVSSKSKAPGMTAAIGLVIMFQIWRHTLAIEGRAAYGPELQFIGVAGLVGAAIIFSLLRWRYAGKG